MGVYAYTGTWLADFRMNHYTHWVGILLKPSQQEVSPSAIKIFLLIILSTTRCQDELLEEKARTELE